MGMDVPNEPPATGPAAAPEPEPSEAGRAAVALAVEVERLRALEAHRRRLTQELDQDVRTPLTPILLQLHLLESHHAAALGPDGLRALAVVRRNVERWAATTERILARLEDERPLREPADVDLARLESEVAHAFSTRALKDGVRLHDLPAEGRLTVRAPPEALRQAVTVLVDQALAATPAGGDVTLMSHRDGDRAVLEVQDGGPGLTPEELQALDEPAAWRADGPARWAVPVLRVALLIESLGGELTLESDGPGLGVSRVVRLPLRLPGAAAPPAVEAGAA